jgi:hypothetical protein
MTPHQIHDNDTGKITEFYRFKFKLDGAKKNMLYFSEQGGLAPTFPRARCAAIWYQDVITTRCGEGAPVAKRL